MKAESSLESVVAGDLFVVAVVEVHALGHRVRSSYERAVKRSSWCSLPQLYCC